MNNNEHSYQAALDYLYSFVDYSLSKTFRYEKVKFDLARLEKLMDILGQPYRDYPIMHVAGTKGKGSVTAMCTSVLQAAGYKTGMYTSPHLHDYAERIQVNKQPIPHKDLVELVDQIKPAVEAVPELTTFEITTALGLLYFQKKKVDAAVVEVGLGGRLDATNVVTPKVSVITSISYDHMYLLGNSLKEIAIEKSGIIKPEVPVVSSPQEEEAKLEIERIAAERASPMIQIGKDYFYAPLDRSLDGQFLMVWSLADQSLVDQFIETNGKSGKKPLHLKIPLLGFHQVENAATAYAALKVFNNTLPVSDIAIQQGLAHVSWPGRFEVLQRKPVVVLDCAHNRDSARRLRNALDDYFAGKSVLMIFGASEDKDLYGMFTELMPRVSQVIATKSIHPRAMEPEQIVETAHHFGRPAHVTSDVADALREAISSIRTDCIVLVTGSIFVVAGVREAWVRLKSTKRINVKINKLG